MHSAITPEVVYELVNAHLSVGVSGRQKTGFRSIPC